MKEIPIHQVYDQRQNFIIVALTGITGSGCSSFAELMATPFEEWGTKKYVRKLDEIKKYYVSSNKQEVVFARKYTTCYNVCLKQYNKPFTIIKYRNVILLYAIKKMSNGSIDEMMDRFIKVLSGKFYRSYRSRDKFTYDVNNHFEKSDLEKWGLTEKLCSEIQDIGEDNVKLSKVYFSPSFAHFCDSLYEELKARDYYAKNFFVHRLGYTIRATGNPEPTHDECLKSDNNHIFDLVEFINHIIKGYHESDRSAPRRFVIDSVRSSLEIMYLRERYNAFYQIALHNDGREENLVRDKVSRYVKDSKHLNEVCANIHGLSLREADKGDFEDGFFFSPDISRCVTESEIHIEYQSLTNLMNEDKSKRDFSACSFYSYGEQWMKFYSLIMRPGLITPSRDERCMSIAYIAKFNSGCISRQVGCTIVDKDFAVQSVGWNDPPSAQLPCELRYVDELITPERLREVNGVDGCLNQNHVYSKFEVEDTKEYKFDKPKGISHHKMGFLACLKDEIDQKVLRGLSDEGLPYPYCFRSRYNTYKGNKDQVNTRSLHAEENTMLRISSVGGIGLKGGTMYVTASPCVLCSKKAYQIGIKDIVYLDPYTDIAPDLIINCGFASPMLRPFRGAIGGTFYKLYQPFLPYKDELSIWEKMLCQ